MLHALIARARGATRGAARFSAVPGALLGALLLAGAIAVALAGLVAAVDPPRAPLLVDFFPLERNAQIDYQFARPSAALLLPDPTAGGRLTMRVMSPAPLPPRALAVADIAGGELLRAEVGAEPRVLRVLLPPPAGPGGLGLRLSTPAARADNDERELGLLYDEVRVEPGQRQVDWLALAAPALLAAAAAGAALAGGVGPAAASAAALGAALLGAGYPVRAAALVGGLAALLLAGRALAPRQFAAVAARLRGAGVRPAAWAVAGLVAAAAAGLGWLAVTSHSLFRTDAYDLGLYDQTFWLISRGLPSYSTAVGINMLGSHAAVVIYPLAALYWIAPDVRLLLLFQALAVALGAVPLYLIGRDRGAPWLGVAAGVAYLLHPSAQNMALFDFHVDTIAATALLFALWAADGRRWRLMLGCCAVVLACKENFAVSTAFLGLWLVLLRREWRVGGLLLVVSAAWFLFATQVLAPALVGRDESLHIGRFSKYGDSVPAILLTAGTRPGLILADMWPPDATGYLAGLLLPFGLLALASPYGLLALPGAAINLLSAEPLQRELLHHYSALPVAVLAVAALDGALRLARLTRGEAPRRWAMGGLAALLLSAAAIAQGADLRRDQIVAQYERRPIEPLIYTYLLAQIPPDAGVSAQGRFHPHLTHRRQTFLFPNPFIPIEFFNPAAMPFAADAAYVIYDTRRPDRFADSAGAKLDLLLALRDTGGFRQVASLNGTVLLRREP